LAQADERRARHALWVRSLALSALLVALALPLAAGAAQPQVGGCPMFPADSAWNARVDGLPVDSRSDAYVASIGRDRGLHPDFGTNPEYGIPYVVVPSGQATVPVSFEYADESDLGLYPVPANPPIEGGAAATGDRHVLIVEQERCRLYELFAAYPNGDGSWRAGSGAIWDLRSHALRPDGWTSADAAGLPILPGLVRRDEVLSGQIEHALRFTARLTRKAHVWPARHDASSSTDPNRPPMGQRFRLKASFDTSGFSADTRVILTAMQRYGIVLADNGSDWFFSGKSDPGWNDDALVSEFRRVRGSEFEAVDVSSLILSADSGQVRAASPTETPVPVPTSLPGRPRQAYLPLIDG
jgi:hypothetical protein